MRSLLILFPISLFVGWRTYVHARAYCERRSSAWRGPLESAAAGGAAALLFILVGTPVLQTQHPLMSVAYVAFYVIATAIVGLLLGMILAATALLVLRVSRASDAAGFS